MVEIKGVAISGSIEAFKAKFGKEEYAKILEKLNAEDKNMFSSIILSNLWYPLDSFVRYIEVLYQLYYGGDYSKLQLNSEEIIDKQLRGIYRLFIQLGTPEFVVKKIGFINSSYFKGMTLEVIENKKGKYIGHYTGFEKQHRVFQYTIIGFYKRAMEISGAKNVKAVFTVPMSDSKYAEITVTWE